MAKWIRWVNRVLEGAGVELRQLPPGHRADAFEEQRELLASHDVHTIFDIGANVGVTARRYAQLFPGATVHCFEPFPDSYAALRAAFPASAPVRTHALAVCDAVGTRTLFVNKGSVTNSLFPTSDLYRERYARSDITTPTGAVTVPTVTVDQFCAEHGISHINVLKLDIQGGELLALRGTERMLASASVDLVYSEVNFSRIYEGQAFFHDLAPLLLGHGYQLYNLFPLTHTRNGIVSWSDAIWVSPTLERDLTARADRRRATARRQH